MVPRSSTPSPRPRAASEARSRADLALAGRDRQPFVADTAYFARLTISSHPAKRRADAGDGSWFLHGTRLTALALTTISTVNPGQGRSARQVGRPKILVSPLEANSCSMALATSRASHGHLGEWHCDGSDAPVQPRWWDEFMWRGFAVVRCVGIPAQRTEARWLGPRFLGAGG